MKTDHDKAHEFMEWLTLRPAVVRWRGERDEPAIGFQVLKADHYFRARFRDWALLTGLPEEQWNDVWEEWEKD